MHCHCTQTTPVKRANILGCKGLQCWNRLSLFSGTVRMCVARHQQMKSSKASSEHVLLGRNGQ